MEEKILDLKNLYDNGINKEIFFKLILNAGNGPTEIRTAYLNNLSLIEWRELYADVKIDITEAQLELFFEYLRKNFYSLFGKNDNKYFVTRSFSNDKKSADNYEFENILLTAFEVI